MTNPPQRPLRRCVLTGTPIQPGDVIMRVRDWRLAGDLPAPSALHRRQEEAGGRTPDRLGSPIYRPAFRRYLELHRTATQAQRDRWWIEWWLIPGAEDALYAAFPALAVDAVLQVRRDGNDWYDVARAVAHTVRWLDRWETRMAAHCRATFALTRPHRRTVADNN